MINSVDKVDKIITLSGTKGIVVELWRETRGHISNICRATGISRQTYYDWMKDDPEFALAIHNVEQELNDDMRDALIQKGADGDMGAITFYLKARHPDFKPQPYTAGAEFKDGDKTMRVIVTRGEND